MGMCELGDEELAVRKPEPKDNISKGFRPFGWYRDSNGYRHYGMIPLSKEEQDDRIRVKASDT
jgi:hypothetical protein